jgi:hypothetical protein
MGNLYALEKLADAVDALVTGAGNVQERLTEAAMRLHSVRPDEIPEDFRRIFVGVKDDLHFAVPQGSEGRILTTLKITGDEDASVIARRILELYLGTRPPLDALRRRGGIDAKPDVPSGCFARRHFVDLSGTDTHRVIQVAHEDPAVAIFAGLGCLDDGFGDFFDLIARNRDLELEHGHEL